MLIVITTALALMAQSAGEDVAYAQLSPEARDRLAACDVDAARFETLMALDHNAFDQDMRGGWRPVGQQDGCEHAAADLLVAYMNHSPHYNPSRPGVVGWHAGQMLAMAGQADQAIAYFETSRSETQAWNLYVDATIAFMRRDRAAAEAARAELATLRPSEAEMAARRQFLADNPRIRMPEGFVEQPDNLPVVDRLLLCWDHPYADAYSGACQG
ncbi:hypothetical protein [Oceanicaulis sp. MMSF_3324]|uniref:hypothetical protein n=1 Tax=Oceanicaulis sp. MMSF_3324 TaxID=3046702 RepID=UPI0027401068|nr:hypothetical protein [Oceanicaulis sp. MMSF_3324]